MFFMMGITEGRKNLNHNQMVTCERCGKLGSYQVYMTYTVLSLFFIPVFKWNKRYFVKMSCCAAPFELDPQIGVRIARGENVEIIPNDLRPLFDLNETYKSKKQCKSCGYTTEEDFEFCPKCGEKF